MSLQQVLVLDMLLQLVLPCQDEGTFLRLLYQRDSQSKDDGAAVQAGASELFDQYCPGLDSIDSEHKTRFACSNKRHSSDKVPIACCTSGKHGCNLYRYLYMLYLGT